MKGSPIHPQTPSAKDRKVKDVDGEGLLRELLRENDTDYQKTTSCFGVCRSPQVMHLQLYHFYPSFTSAEKGQCQDQHLLPSAELGLELMKPFQTELGPELPSMAPHRVRASALPRRAPCAEVTSAPWHRRGHVMSHHAMKTKQHKPRKTLEAEATKTES